MFLLARQPIKEAENSKKKGPKLSYNNTLQNQSYLTHNKNTWAKTRQQKSLLHLKNYIKPLWLGQKESTRDTMGDGQVLEIR